MVTPPERDAGNDGDGEKSAPLIYERYLPAMPKNRFKDENIILEKKAFVRIKTVYSLNGT